MGKAEIIDSLWLEYLGWNKTMYENQVGYGKMNGFPTHRMFFEELTETNFWRWYFRDYLPTHTQSEPINKEKHA